MDLDELAKRAGLSREEVERQIELARRSLVPKAERINVIENGVRSSLHITRDGVGPINTQFGTFQHFVFRLDDKWSKYSVLVKAPLSPEFRPQFSGHHLLLRIDSGCETGQVFGDRTCECRQQLELGMKHIADAGEGCLMSIPRQDGRGLGLPFKLATLRLQEELSLNTVEASKMIDPDGLRDTRTYAGVIGILKFFGVPKEMQVRLASNNPSKLTIFHENGYENSILTPIVIEPTEFTRQHLIAKQQELGHINLVTNDEGGLP